MVHRNGLCGLAGLSYRHEVKSPRDVATGHASGRRQHGPITITKEWGAATTQIFQAFTTNEVLKSVLFEFVKTTPEGVEVVYMTVKLTNTIISSVTYSTATALANSANTAATGMHELEEVSFTYQKIEIENKASKLTASDDWTK